MTLILPDAERLSVPQEWQAYDLHYESDYPGPWGDFSHPSGVAVAFGAGDPEADGAQRICYREGIPFWLARGEHGGRLEPYEAYQGVVHDPRMREVAKLATFETAIDGLTPAKVIDHHGDKAPDGLDMSFENSLHASSGGQLIDWLREETGRDIKYTRTEKIIFILDHRAAFLLHEGLGDISPQEARHEFVHEVVRSNRNEPLPTAASIEEVNENIDVMVDEIGTAEVSDDFDVPVVDFREKTELRPGYREDSLVLKAAASIAGKVVWARSPDNSSQHRMTEIFTGLVTPDHVQAFDRMVEARNMIKACVDEQRGIAIAYPTDLD